MLYSYTTGKIIDVCLNWNMLTNCDVELVTIWCDTECSLTIICIHLVGSVLASCLQASIFACGVISLTILGILQFTRSSILKIRHFKNKTDILNKL